MVQSLDQESTGMKREKNQINTFLISKKGINPKHT